MQSHILDTPRGSERERDRQREQREGIPTIIKNQTQTHNTHII
jgi:hypothetical protein